MNILYLIVGFIIALTGCATSPKPVDTEDVRIGVIDIQKILQYSKAARQARESRFKDVYPGHAGERHGRGPGR